MCDLGKNKGPGSSTHKIRPQLSNWPERYNDGLAKRDGIYNQDTIKLISCPKPTFLNQTTSQFPKDWVKKSNKKAGPYTI